MNITTANFFVKKKTHRMHIIHMQSCWPFSTIFSGYIALPSSAISLRRSSVSCADSSSSLQKANPAPQRGFMDPLKKIALLPTLWYSNASRILKNAHLRRSPRPSSLQRTPKYVSLPRTSGAPADGISQSSTCICLPPEASAQAGAFLSILQRNHFFSSP